MSEIGFFKTHTLFLPLEKESLCIILWIHISFAFTFNETPNILELLLALQDT